MQVSRGGWTLGWEPITPKILCDRRYDGQWALSTAAHSWWSHDITTFHA
jgi:hypothetical protein